VDDLPDFFSVAIYIGTTLIIQRKPCALTGFNINMTPEGNYTWRPDARPTGYSFELSFKETTVPTKEYEKNTRLLGV
jgi:cobalamin biosynthesis Mg chelatase CobN